MNAPETSGQPSVLRKAAGFSVHVFTASGAACALLALLAATAGQWSLMFIWLGLALIIDGVDGTLARHLKVAELFPRWSGDMLDFVVDYATYVFVPAYALVASGLVPPPGGLALGILIAVTGALYFADRSMKTTDGYFRGFPALWNVAVFYLFVLRPAPWITAIGVIVLAAATFAPIYFVHPVRVRRWHKLNIALLVLGSVLALFTLVQNFDTPVWVGAGLLATLIYFVIVGLLRTAE